MEVINSLTEIEKQCILRFLHEIAQTDYKVVEEEICTINRIGQNMGMKIDCSEQWVLEEWTPDNGKMLSDLMENNCDFSGSTDYIEIDEHDKLLFDAMGFTLSITVRSKDDINQAIWNSLRDSEIEE